MQTEYEATFVDVKKEMIRERLQSVGARLIYPESLQRRVNFYLPEKSKIREGWIRVRDEKESVTMSIKSIIDNNSIESQKELCLRVDDFSKAKDFLEMLGCQWKSYQETKRELWIVDYTEVSIDEWPWLEPFVEIEGTSEKEVQKVSERLGFDWNNALFGAVDIQYQKKYGISKIRINNETPRFSFEDPCPFLDKK